MEENRKTNALKIYLYIINAISAIIYLFATGLLIYTFIDCKDDDLASLAFFLALTYAFILYAISMILSILGKLLNKNLLYKKWLSISHKILIYSPFITLLVFFLLFTFSPLL